MDNVATFDPARELKLFFRCNRNGSLVFTFINEDLSPYNLIYEDVELNIYPNQGAKKKMISLVSGDGVSYAGNVVTITITADVSNVNEGTYYYELYRPDLGKTWLTGDAIFHNGKFDGVDPATGSITVTESGDPVTITVSGEITATSVGSQITTALTGYLTSSNTAVSLVDGAAITLTATKHTLTTAQAAVTITDSYTGDFIGIEVILSGITATTWTLPANSLGAYNGTASGTNTLVITGATAGDRIVISRWKVGSNYSYVAFNMGQ